MASNSSFSIPPIVVETPESEQEEETASPSSTSLSPFPSHSRTPSEIDTLREPRLSTGDLLAPRSAVSIDGETLRSRADSFNSNVSTLGSATAIPIYDDVSLADALRPDKRNERDFQVDKNPFAFSPGQLNKMLNPKSLQAFRALGGPRGLERGLRTDLASGLSLDESRLDGAVSFEDATRVDDGKQKPTASPPVDVSAKPGSQFADRIRVFDRNKLPERKGDGWWILFWRAYNDKIIILLTIAAVVSLALGLYQTFSGHSDVEWVEGVAIVVAILIVTLVTAGNDWQKERQFAKLNRRKNDREVKAIRSGKSVMISIFDITAGDVLHLEPGDAIPADGIFLSGHGVKCDESSATGESDQMKKTSAHEVWLHLMDGTATKKLDPFIISGSKVLEGVGTYLVTSVGPNSTYGKIMMSLQTGNDPTPLQFKLGRLANWIGGLGSAAALFLFVILFIRYLVQLSGSTESAAVKGRDFMAIVVVAITMIVVAIPEGLPLAVTLALAFATTRMVKENNLVRVLRACETMGNATVICSDKTGTLTQNKMTVVSATFGANDRFDQAPDEDDGITKSVFQKLTRLSADIRELIVKSIALNSTAFEGEENGQKTFIGSKTEVAMLHLAQTFLGMELPHERASAEVAQLIPFDSSRKCMGVVVHQKTGGYRLYVKGAAELMLAQATKFIANLEKDNYDLEPLQDETKADLLEVINSYSSRSLRTIAMLYKDFESWPPAGAKTLEDDDSSVEFGDVFHDMIWVGVVGIQDPLRPEVPGAIRRCNNAGVAVKMVTGDNLTTAVAIATECGIFTPGAIAMEGPKFRQLSDQEMDEVLPNLRVLARSSPEDKRILVERLKHLGETVAVTGDGTNDGPALKTADVGFSMGIAGTEVAKEASSIILLDDNFKSIVTAIAWGRAVNDAVAKFLQFQITVNITAVCLTFVSAVANDNNEAVLSAVQLLWVNLIMDTFAALALATDAPTEKILNRKPVPKSAPLFTPTMWKMIIGQSIYQLVVTFTLHFAGARILDYDMTDTAKVAQLRTIVFNTFVWMQIFNEFNNRRLDNNFNIFEGMLKNYWFMGINCIMVGGQIMIIFVGGEAIRVVRLDPTQWGICLLCAIFCVPWAVVLRCIPDRYAVIAIDVVSKVFMVVWTPFAKSVKFVFSPVTKTFRAIGRVSKRTTRKVFKKGKTSDDSETKQNVDEEAQLPEAKDEKSANSSAPPDLPPITLTAPNTPHMVGACGV